MKPSTAALLLTLSLATSPASGSDAAEAHWHQWRGPENNGVSRTATPPLEWGEQKNLGWKVEIGGHGTSSPIVWGDKVFITAARNTGEVDPSLTPPEDQPERVFGIKHPNTSFEMIVACFDRETGETLWREVATTTVPHEGHHKDASFASGSPFCDGERLYCWFGSAGLFAYDLDGEKLWERDLGQARVGASLGEGSSPVVHDGKIVLVRDHAGQSTIEVLDAADGEAIWKEDRAEANSWATPAIVEHDGVTQVITTASNRVRSYDLESGEVIWWATGLTSNCTPCPIVDGDTVYCMSGYQGRALLAIPITGKGDVTGSIRWRSETGTPYVPSPVLYDGQLYFTQSNQGILTSVMAEDGAAAFERVRVPELGDTYASPVAADGRIYLTGRKGSTVVIESGTDFKVLASNRLDDSFHASPALAGDQLFLRGMRFLYCLQEGGTADGTSFGPATPQGAQAPAAEADAPLRQLLQQIAQRPIPDDYPGGAGHQPFVDNWFKNAPPQKGGRVAELWRHQRRLFPEMENRGLSFIRILDYVRSGEGAAPSPAAPEADEPAPLRILCVGDSITEGGRFPCYRAPLYEMLTEDGIAFEFVGSKSSAHGELELRHEGYGGKNLGFLLETIPRKFAEHPADLVLIHAGHNNFARDAPVPGLVRDTRALIAALRDENPGVTVFLAQVITSGKLPKYSYIPDLNAALAELAEDITTGQSEVVLVDHATGFDFETMAVADKVHPNEAGANHMAGRWAEAIVTWKSNRAAP